MPFVSTNCLYLSLSPGAECQRDGVRYRFWWQLGYYSCLRQTKSCNTFARWDGPRNVHSYHAQVRDPKSPSVVESFNAAHTPSEPFATPKRDEFAVFSGVTSTMRAVASTPLPLLNPSSVSSTPSSPETHCAASGSTHRPSQLAAPQPSSRPASLETETPPWSQVHPAPIDQLVSFEPQKVSCSWRQI